MKIPKKSRETKRTEIKLLLEMGWSALDISKKLNTSTATVYRWQKRISVKEKQRIRPSKFTKEIDAFLINRAGNKFTNIGGSGRVLAAEVSYLFDIKISKAAINRRLLKLLNRPLRPIKTFQLLPNHRITRQKFCKFIQDKKLKGSDIFFTDEKRFYLNPPTNSQTNRIRFTHEYNKRRLDGDNAIHALGCNATKAYDDGFMVAGGVCENGVSKLTLCVGTMNSYAYNDALKFYADDVRRLGPDLYFQQDGASCHGSYISKCCIHGKNKADTMVKKPKIPEGMTVPKDKYFNNALEFWPPCSPDLSPIEDIWAIVEDQLAKRQSVYNSLKDKMTTLVDIWNKIPVELCKRLVKSFDKRIETVKPSGYRLNKFLLKKRCSPEEKEEKKMRENLNWNHRWNKDNDFNIVYNDDTLENLKAKEIKKNNSMINSLRTEHKKEIIHSNKSLRKCGREFKNSMKDEGPIELENWENKELSLYLNNVKMLSSMKVKDYYKRLQNEKILEKTINLNPKITAFSSLYSKSTEFDSEEEINEDD